MDPVPPRIEQCPSRCPSEPAVRCQQFEGHEGVHWAVAAEGRTYAWTPRRLDPPATSQGAIRWTAPHR